MSSGSFIDAQDLRLIENQWYLTKTIANGNEQLPPMQSGLTFIPDEQVLMAFGRLNMYFSISFDADVSFSGSNF